MEIIDGFHDRIKERVMRTTEIWMKVHHVVIEMSKEHPVRNQFGLIPLEMCNSLSEVIGKIIWVLGVKTVHHVSTAHRKLLTNPFETKSVLFRDDSPRNQLLTNLYHMNFCLIEVRKVPISTKEFGNFTGARYVGAIGTIFFPIVEK